MIDRKNQLLIHGSLVPQIDILKPGVCDGVFASDSISFATLCALGKKFNEKLIHFYIYQVFNKPFIICSIDEKIAKDVFDTKITYYFCSSDDFTKTGPGIATKYSRITLNLIKGFGYEWICKKEVKPVKRMEFYINDLVHCNTHTSKDSKFLIVIKYLTSLLKLRYSLTSKKEKAFCMLYPHFSIIEKKKR